MPPHRPRGHPTGFSDQEVALCRVLVRSKRRMLVETLARHANASFDFEPAPYVPEHGGDNEVSVPTDWIEHHPPGSALSLPSSEYFPTLVRPVYSDFPLPKALPIVAPRVPETYDALGLQHEHPAVHPPGPDWNAVHPKNLSVHQWFY